MQKSPPDGRTRRAPLEDRGSWLRLAFLAVLFVLTAAAPYRAADAQPPRVVASIPPLQSLAAGVMAGIGNPTLLIPGGSTPHSYALRPSDVRALEHATIVVWVGPELESFLARAIAARAKKATVLSVMKLPGMTLLRLRGGGLWRLHKHDNEPAKPNTDQRMRDPHVWLSPDNARAIVAGIAKALTKVDPTHAERYSANASAMTARIATLDEALRRQLKPVQKTPYLVFHDAYHYFERHYGLTPIGAVTLTPERPPGAWNLSELRRHVRSSGARCIFTEPQFRPNIVAALKGGPDNILEGVLDPLGAGLTPGPVLWFELMHGLADSLSNCLSDSL